MELGETIGGYEIVARLRSGGMANLFLGRRRGAAGFSRPVVIKVIHPHLASDEDFVHMFVDEAKISARIDHPNVVHVEELGEEEGMYYLVMEYVHGVSLGELTKALRKKERALSPELATAIAIRVADGLHGAHETRDQAGDLLHIVHRDVSPQNVLISYRGHVKLIDFGVAKARGRASQTEGGSLKGKIRYMSPQQAFGGHVDRRADIYSLAIVLWEILTQQHLFRATNDMALLEMVRSPDVAPPSYYNDAVPPALDEAVMRALSPNPDARPPTGLEFRSALAAAVPGAAGLPAAEVAKIVAAVTGDKVQARAAKLRKKAPGLEVQQSGGHNSLTDTQVSKVLAQLTHGIDPSRQSDPPSQPSGSSKVSWPSATPPPISASVATSGEWAEAPRRGVPRWLLLVVFPLAIAGGVAFAFLGTHSDSGQPPARPSAASAPNEDPVLTPRPEPQLIAEVALVDASDGTTDADVADANDADAAVEVAEVVPPPETTTRRSGASMMRGRRGGRMMGMREDMTMEPPAMISIPIAGEDEF